jgi:LmbE family N-acetylglucosaminyl deacetylase
VLQLARPGADVFVPDGAPSDAALARVTHLGVGAHADDLEIMAWHGIREGLAAPAPCFGGIVCTDGSGAPQPDAAAPPDAGTRPPAALRDVRRAEQRDAARRGRYAVAIQLDHPSASLKRGVAPAVVRDLATLIAAAQPRVVYTHSPADAHDTHVGVCVAAVAAIRTLPPDARPAQVWGCEVWRSLDWAPRAQALPLGRDDEAATWQALLHVFSSQNRARPYDRGAPARACANAVFRESHAAGGDEPAWLALDLTPATRDGGPDLAALLRAELDAFSETALAMLGRVSRD